MNKMLTIGLLLKATDQMSSIIGGAANKSITSLGKLQEKVKKVSDSFERAGRSMTANGMMIGGVLQYPIRAFADLDEASTNLRVALMDNLGAVPAQFAEINRQAVELGNKLPGTTADFVNAATALAENGTALEQITGGGLRAASYLSVILKQPARDAAEMTAKFRESFGLAEHELVKMADLTQRAKFAFGLNPDEIKYAAQYQGATLNALHLTGASNAKLMLAFQGYARQRGMEGSVFGTNFAQMLNQIGMLSDKLSRNSKPMKEVNAELKQYGINLQFFDGKGKFMGIENLMAQMSKLRVLTEQQRLHVNNRLFGMEGGRVASLSIDMGPEGLRKNLALMDKQASLMQRIDVVTKSAKNTWDAFTGTATNLAAALGGPMTEALYPLINRLNELTGGPLQKWVEQHKTLVKWLGLGAIAVAVLLVVLGGASMVISTVVNGVGAAIAVFGALGTAIKVVTQIVVWSGRLMMTNPVVLAVMAIALAAYLIYEYWEPIKAFFLRVWGAVNDVFAKYPILNFIFPVIGAARFLINHWKELPDIFQRLWSKVNGVFEKYPILNLLYPIVWIVRTIVRNWDVIKPYFLDVWSRVQTAFSGGIKGIVGLILDCSPIGMFYTAFQKVLKYFGIDLPPQFSDAIKPLVAKLEAWFDIANRIYDKFAEIGKQAMVGLWHGIRDFATLPLDAANKVSRDLINGFKAQMGIKSPSRVMMQLGTYISQGTALGITQASPLATRAAANMGAGAAQGTASTLRPAKSGGSMSVHFNPVIHVAPGAGAADVTRAVADAVRLAQAEFERMLGRVEAQRGRRSFT